MNNAEIFRFVNVRPVQRIAEGRQAEQVSTHGEAQTPLQAQVEALKGADARAHATILAQERLKVEDPKRDDVRALIQLVRTASAAKTVAKAKEVVADFAGSQQAARLRESLWDRLYAHVLAPDAQPDDRNDVYRALRAFHFLDILPRLQDDQTPMRWTALSRVTLTIPKTLIPPGPPIDPRQGDRYKEAAQGALDQAHTRMQELTAAIDELRNVDRMYRAQLRASADQSSGTKKSQAGSSFGGIFGRLAGTKPVVIRAKTPPWVFDNYGQKHLSDQTKQVLAVRRSALQEKEVGEIIDALERERHDQVTAFLERLAPAAFEHLHTQIKFADLLAKVPVAGYKFKPVPPLTPLLPPPPPAPAPAPPAPAPTAVERGIHPLGIGDLLLVKQELLRYVTGEVAHIENVMATEFKTRKDSRLREVEETVITETEHIEESERDLQTTERFELQKEAQTTIEQQMSLQAGVSVTGSYGPVSVTAHADFALSQSSTESNRTASTYAKEVTEKSVSKILSRVREQRMRRSLERYKETNEHGFENRGAGAQNVIGIYCWVDKYYRARLINYGRRMMFEFIVPEPAAFYLHVQSMQTPKGVTLKQPEPPVASGHPLEPKDLTRSNYRHYVAQYNVQDMPPYPDEVVRIGAAYAEAAGGNANQPIGKTSEKLVVPAGYRCSDLYGTANWMGWDGYFIDILMAGLPFNIASASDLEGIIPISVEGWGAAFEVNVVATCQLKDEAREAWQLKAFQAIQNAYEQALADYNEQVASAQIQAGVAIEGRNPAFNREIEADELKKGVLRLLTNNFASTVVNGVTRVNEIFNAMQASGQFGYPEFDNAEAIVEGKMIQFFEQAFEWDNMTYRFYPYVWGRKENWKDVFPLTDTDPLFTDFLRAGAARVIVPVHPPYNETILHYTATNEIWNGGEPPTLYDPLFISIVDELKADSHAELDGELPACDVGSDYPCLADDWEVKLPTTLVYLQKDAVLPDYTQAAAGGDNG